MKITFKEHLKKNIGMVAVITLFGGFLFRTLVGLIGGLVGYLLISYGYVRIFVKDGSKA